MFAYSRRIFFFVVTNLAVVLMLGIVWQVLGLDQYLARSGYGVSYTSMLVWSAFMGFFGSLISLALSKTMAKHSVGARVIDQPQNDGEAWLVETVQRLAKDAGIGMPQVAVFPAPEPNAFATGARRDHALVAVSEGLLRSMNKPEIEAVLGHEISHVANGDMVTMALLQGVVNTFVYFLSRVIGYAVDAALSGRRDEDRRGFGGGGIGYFVTVMISQIFLGIIASIIVMWYSRRREFRADAGAAKLRGKEPMIAALGQLARAHDQPSSMPQSLAAFGIRGGTARAILGSLLSSHPPIADRIEALQALPE